MKFKLPDRGEQTDYKSTNRQEKQNAKHSIEENRGTINQQIDRKNKMQSIAFCLSHLIDDYSFCKRNSMTKSHELPDIDKLEENRGTINQK